MTVFTADLFDNPQSFIPLVVVSLSLMIPIVAIIVDYFQKKAKMRLVEKAIEHGMDPEALKLNFECDSGPPMPYRAGTVTLAVGIALILGARYAPQTIDILHFFATIGGAVCACVGIGLLINDWVNRDRFRELREQDKSGSVQTLR